MIKRTDKCLRCGSMNLTEKIDKETYIKRMCKECKYINLYSKKVKDDRQTEN